MNLHKYIYIYSYIYSCVNTQLSQGIMKNKELYECCIKFVNDGF